jgi:hypothetical protein
MVMIMRIMAVGMLVTACSVIVRMRMGMFMAMLIPVMFMNVFMGMRMLMRVKMFVVFDFCHSILPFDQKYG